MTRRKMKPGIKNLPTRKNPGPGGFAGEFTKHLEN
jgi:hypothetical protein